MRNPESRNKSSHDKAVLYLVAGLVLLSGTAALLLALITPPNPPPLIGQAFNAFLSAFTLGGGALVTLVGVKHGQKQRSAPK